MPTSRPLIDDRRLVDLLTSEATRPVHTTSLWYYRACRAAVLGAGGQLSGPFAGLPAALQERALAAMLRLPSSVSLPDPRSVVPAMVELSARHPRLNVMNLEAAAAAQVLGAPVELSPRAAEGVLPAVLDAEAIAWSVA